MEKSIIHSASRQPSQRFEVKLDDSSFLVSLKKLQTERGEGNKDGAPSHDKLRIDPALEARFDPRNEALQDPGPSEQEPELPLPQPQNRFSSVIERIERLYMGHESDNENGNEDEREELDTDQYDTNDSFIDDRELDDYFTAAKTKAAHGGYFVNKGHLQQLDKDSLPPIPKPRKATKVKTVKELNLETKSTVQPGADSKETEPQVMSRMKDQARGISPAPKSDAEEAKSNLEKVKLNVKDKEQEKPKRKLNQATDPNKKPAAVKSTVSNQESTQKIPGKWLTKAIEEFTVAIKSIPLPSKAEPGAIVAEGSNSQTRMYRPRMPKEILGKLRKVVHLSAKESKVPTHVVSQLLEITKDVMQPHNLKKHVRSMLEQRVGVNQKRGQTLESGKQLLASLISEDVEQIKKLLAEKGTETAMAEGEKESTSKAIAAKWTVEIEDAMFKIYNEFLEGAEEEENLGVLTKKLYSDLAALWPNGIVDYLEVKSAIQRAKNRQKRESTKLDKAEKKLLTAPVAKKKKNSLKASVNKRETASAVSLNEEKKGLKAGEPVGLDSGENEAQPGEMK